MHGNIHESRKKVTNSPENDFYQTPKCCTRELFYNYLHYYPKDMKILDPCCGKYAIGNVLREFEYNNLVETDLMYGQDFLDENYAEEAKCIVMNPPFKDFDAFVTKAKKQVDIVCSIGRLNFFGAHKRNIDGLWKNLKYVLIFDRQIAYDKPFREDGRVECGMLISCWFVWDKNYEDNPMIKIIDMQKYIVSQKEKTDAAVEEMNRFIAEIEGAQKHDQSDSSS